VGTKASATAGAKVRAKVSGKVGSTSVANARAKAGSKAGVKASATRVKSTQILGAAAGANGEADAQPPPATTPVASRASGSASLLSSATRPSPPSGNSARRGRSAFGLAADALRLSTSAAAAPKTTKRAAAAKPTSSPARPPKRSRRLEAREQLEAAERRIAAARETAAASATATDAPAVAVAASQAPLSAVANRAVCTLLSELGVPVATGRLLKERRKVSNRWIDPDMAAVELCSILEPSVAYPYNDRYPLAPKRSAVVHLDGHVGTTIVWSVESVSFS